MTRIARILIAATVVASPALCAAGAAQMTHAGVKWQPLAGPQLGVTWYAPAA